MFLHIILQYDYLKLYNYLLGFDFDQICSNSSTNYNRFYGLSKITDTKEERRIETYTKEKTADSWYRRWLTNKQLIMIREFSKKNNIQIVNASMEGILNIFPRVPLNKVLGKSK